MGNEIELASVITDIAAGPFGSNLKVECFVPYGFPIIDGANLKGYKVTDNLTKFVTEEKARFLSRSIARRGDVVVTISGTLGQIAYIPEDSMFEEYLCSQRQFRVSFDTSQVYVPYLVFYFHTFEGQNKILSFANQTGVPALSQPLKNFKKIRLYLPDYPTQKKIASIIEAFNDKIECNQKINDNLEQQAVALFKSWFVDFSLFGGTVPENWEDTTLENITTLITRGIAPKYSDNSDQTVVNQKCIRNHTIDLSLARTHTPKTINEKWLKFGDLLINSTGDGTLGRVAQVWFAPKALTVDSHVTIVRPAREELIFYIGLWGILHEKEIESLHTGSTGQTELPRDRVKMLKLFLPDNISLGRFNSIIAPMASTIISNQEENQKLANLRDTLLPKLMSGEIDVFNIQF